MKDIYLVQYSVKGIKTLDQLTQLSFYKKTISNNPDTQDYNVKGIYGMNGSGKSGIVASVDILKNILVNSSYLNNVIVQKYLDAIVNKKTGELSIEADYLAKIADETLLFRYQLILSKDPMGKYAISYECLSSKKATSKSDAMQTILKVMNGEIKYILGEKKDEYSRMMSEKTINLLSNASSGVLFFEKVLIPCLKENKVDTPFLFQCLFFLWYFGKKVYVYLDQSDNHKDYFLYNFNGDFSESTGKEAVNDSLSHYIVEMDREQLNAISITDNFISKFQYESFTKTVNKLYEFLHIFKSDLKGIEIDRKENQNILICSLIMVYDSYKIHAEFESTGIKKLIKLFLYLREMVQGGIIFIDEFDSNLHDVYLCALLEYLMEYGQGQLCFTTHNVGPMDILKQHKKSIDFLSTDHKIYPWTTNGNYSPSKLYRNGMIEGSPFNVDSIDFIGVFGSGEEGE